MKIYHWLFAIVVFIIGLILIVFNAWASFSTIMQRPGLNGDMYSYYGLTRTEYAVYTSLAAIAEFYIVALLLLALAKNDLAKLKRAFKYFIVIFLIFIACEILMVFRFTGKG